MKADAVTSLGPVEQNPGTPDKQAQSDTDQGGGLREQEHAWCRSHVDELRAFSGEWVILEGERIVGHGKDPAALIPEARRQGIKIPYIFHIGEANENVTTIGL